jgi:magnesium-transporting ATPase (P-type)
VREDYVRHREDKRANSRLVQVVRDGQVRTLAWKDIVVGDVVKVLRGHEFPADLVFLAAGHEDPEQRGVCHVQTAQLDGETNLKLRLAPDAVVQLLQSDDDCTRFRATLICEEPNEHFGSFSGNLLVTSSASGGRRLSTAAAAAASDATATATPAAPPASQAAAPA